MKWNTGAEKIIVQGVPEKKLTSSSFYEYHKNSAKLSGLQIYIFTKSLKLANF